MTAVRPLVRAGLQSGPSWAGTDGCTCMQDVLETRELVQRIGGWLGTVDKASMRGVNRLMASSGREVVRGLHLELSCRKEPHPLLERCLGRFSGLRTVRLVLTDVPAWGSEAPEAVLLHKVMGWIGRGVAHRLQMLDVEATPHFSVQLMKLACVWLGPATELHMRGPFVRRLPRHMTAPLSITTRDIGPFRMSATLTSVTLTACEPDQYSGAYVLGGVHGILGSFHRAVTPMLHTLDVTLGDQIRMDLDIHTSFDLTQMRHMALRNVDLCASRGMRTLYQAAPDLVSLTVESMRQLAAPNSEASAAWGSMERLVLRCLTRGHRVSCIAPENMYRRLLHVDHVFPGTCRGDERRPTVLIAADALTPVCVRSQSTGTDGRGHRPVHAGRPGGGPDAQLQPAPAPVHRRAPARRRLRGRRRGRPSRRRPRCLSPRSGIAAAARADVEGAVRPCASQDVVHLGRDPSRVVRQGRVQGP